MSLVGAVAIVTGAAGGLGAAIAEALAAEGAIVARTEVSGADLELDVRDRGSVERGVAAVAAEHGPPTILVNNAGVNRIAPSETLEEELWAEVVDVNVGGAFRCSQVVGARMLTAGGGAIVNVASISGLVGMPGRAAYCATKAGRRLPGLANIWIRRRTGPPCGRRWLAYRAPGPASSIPQATYTP